MNRDITYCNGDNCKKKELCSRYMNINPKTSYFFNPTPVREKEGKQTCDFYKKIEK